VDNFGDQVNRAVLVYSLILIFATLFLPIVFLGNKFCLKFKKIFAAKDEFNRANLTPENN